MERSEQIGLGVSAMAHAAFIAALALGLLHWSAPEVLAPPAFEVALTDNIALESRAQSHEEAQSAQAPELGPTDPEDMTPDQATIAEEPKVTPKPDPKPVVKPEPPKP